MPNGCLSRTTSRKARVTGSNWGVLPAKSLSRSGLIQGVDEDPLVHSDKVIVGLKAYVTEDGVVTR